MIEDEVEDVVVVVDWKFVVVVIVALADEVIVVEVVEEDVFVELVVIDVVVVLMVVEVVVLFSCSHHCSMFFGSMLETLSEIDWPPAAC